MQTADERERIALGLFAEVLAREDMDVRSRLEWLEAAAGRDHGVMHRVVRLMEADSVVAGPGIAAETPPALVPEDFDGYELLELLSVEPSGPVYRARLLVRSVIVRFIRPGPDRSGQGALIVAALPALAQVEHPSLAAILEGGTAPGGFGYIVSEDVVGMPVRACAETAGLDAEAAVELFRQAAAALAHAHAYGIAHGNLTADRILVTPDGRPVLTDFAGSLFRQGGLPSGTREDVRALAAVMAAVLERLPPARLNPEDLAAILARGVSAGALAGYQSAEALADDLARWQACEPVDAVPATFAYPVKRALQRRPVRLGMALLGVAGALTALAILLR